MRRYRTALRKTLVANRKHKKKQGKCSVCSRRSSHIDIGCPTCKKRIYHKLHADRASDLQKRDKLQNETGKCMALVIPCDDAIDIYSYDYNEKKTSIDDGDNYQHTSLSCKNVIQYKAFGNKHSKIPNFRAQKLKKLGFKFKHGVVTGNVTVLGPWGKTLLIGEIKMLTDLKI